MSSIFKKQMQKSAALANSVIFKFKKNFPEFNKNFYIFFIYFLCNPIVFIIKLVYNRVENREKHGKFAKKYFGYSILE